MKLTNIIGFAAALLCCAPFVGAQEEGAAQDKLRAYVQAGKMKKPAVQVIEAAGGKNVFQYIPKGAVDQKMQMDVKSCALFMLMTPDDLADALGEYRAGELDAARKELAKVKQKYSRYLGLPGNPSAIASVYELKTAVRQKDWAAVTGLADGLPKDDPSLNDFDLTVAKVAPVVAAAAAGGDAAPVEAMLKDKDLLKTVSSEVYGWLCYAHGCALEAKVKNGITAENAKTAGEAIDRFCQCVVSHHGVAPELPLDSMKRAFSLLWNMPGVQDYAKSVKAPLDAKAWSGAPVNFRDAVAMAQLLKTVYAPEAKDELVDKAATYYYNTAKDRKKD